MSAVPRVGLFGKLPSRGDFVRLGLPRSFTDPWDDWWQAGMLAAQALADDGGRADEWDAAWTGMPAWRFFLPAGACGPEAVAGVVLPSLDRAGRCYPLTLAATSPNGWDERFLDGAEVAGRAALEAELAPDLVLVRLGPYGSGSGLPGEVVFVTRDGVGQRARAIRCDSLPRPAVLAGMIGAGALAASGESLDEVAT